MGEQTYIVCHIAPIFIYYERTIKKIGSKPTEATKITKSDINCGIAKVNAIGTNFFLNCSLLIQVLFFDSNKAPGHRGSDGEQILNIKVSGPPSTLPYPY